MGKRLFLILFSLIFFCPFNGFSCPFWKRWCCCGCLCSDDESKMRSRGRTVSSVDIDADARAERELWSLVQKVRWVRGVFTDLGRRTGLENLVKLDLVLSNRPYVTVLREDAKNPDVFFASLTSIPIVREMGGRLTQKILEAIRYSFTLADHYIPLTIFVDGCLSSLLDDNSNAGNEILKSHLAFLVNPFRGS
jgi:hypothetical protein